MIHRVFARHLDGHTVHGYVRDFTPAEGWIHIAIAPNAQPVAYALEAIETVVFVGDEDPSRADWREGLPQPDMGVELPSGEALSGRYLAGVDGVGFWLAPQEADFEDVRIFIPQDAPIRFSMRPRAPRQAPPPITRGQPVVDLPQWLSETPHTRRDEPLVLPPAAQTERSTLPPHQPGLGFAHMASDQFSPTDMLDAPPPRGETDSAPYWQFDTMNDLGTPIPELDCDDWAATTPEPFKAVSLESLRAADRLVTAQLEDLTPTARADR